MSESEVALSQDGLAESLNSTVDEFHDTVVSSNPFEWTNRSKNEKQGLAAIESVRAALRAYQHQSKSATVSKILIFGTAVPFVAIATMYFLHLPFEGKAMWGYLVLAFVAVVSAITAAFVGHNPVVDYDFALLSYTAPRGWSFSRANARAAWKALVKRYPYFNQGSEDQEIRLRIWGYMDDEKTLPFMMFHFYYETVTYVPMKVGKTTVMQKVETPHHHYGLFITVPESKVRFRITEVGGSAGLEDCIKFEYSEFNESVDVWCNSETEMDVRKFLSPAVLEIAHELSGDLHGMLLDFYPGYVMLVCENDFLAELADVPLDEEAGSFEEAIQPGIDSIDEFRLYINERLNSMRKYND